MTTVHSSHILGGKYGNACVLCGCGSQTLTAERECEPTLAAQTSMADEEAELVALTAQPQPNGAAYRVAYDGRIMGDDRGFFTLAACEAEIESRLAVDARDAVRFERPLLYRKG